MDINDKLEIDKEEAEALYRYFHTSAGYIHSRKFGYVHQFVNRLAAFLKKDTHMEYDKNRRSDV